MASNNEKTQQTISRIVEAHYGDLRGLFEAHNWAWKGNQSMNASATLIARHYGNIRAFDVAHPISLFQTHRKALLMSEWRWVPNKSGSLNFRYSADRQSVIDKTRDPFLVLVYITNKAAKDQKHLENQVVGFLEVNHVEGDRENFDASDFEYDHRSSYEHALKVRRAFEFFPQQPVKILEILPDLRQRKTMIQDLNKGIVLTPDQLSTISRLPYKEVRVHGSEGLFENEVFLPKDTFEGQERPLDSSDPFQDNPSVWITSFWGYSPETWGCVGFTSEARPRNIIKETTDPFIMAIYVTETAPGNSPFKGKIAGYYELSHEIGLKEDFIATDQMNAAHHPEEKWAHSFKALRAWEIDDAFKPTIKEFHPDLVKNKQQQTVSTWAKALPAEQIERLRALPCKEVQVFKQAKVETLDSLTFAGSGRVGGGNFRGGGYEVGEPNSHEKQIYILELLGDANDFVESVRDEQKIYKVGLSAWPPGRKMALNAALPNGKFVWVLRNMTENEALAPYSTFKIAKVGEDAMKDFLAEKHRSPDDATRHLGGEFYLVDENSIEKAWSLGCSAANKAESEQNG